MSNVPCHMYLLEGNTSVPIKLRYHGRSRKLFAVLPRDILRPKTRENRRCSNEKSSSDVGASPSHLTGRADTRPSRYRHCVRSKQAHHDQRHRDRIFLDESTRAPPPECQGCLWQSFAIRG